MKKILIGLFFLIVLQCVYASEPTAVFTFHSIGIYWSPNDGATDNECKVRYRPLNSQQWKQGLSLWFDSNRNEYRGSLVYLNPGTEYEIELSLQKTGTKTTFTAKTWSENFPIAKTIPLPETSSSTLQITESGSANGYILYTHAKDKTATIDVNNNYDHCINIRNDLHHVIIRGLILKDGKKYGIKLNDGVHDIVIEENDISGWGDGGNYQAAVYSHWNDVVEKIIVQRNKIHHPRSGSNSWVDGHPYGPQAVGFDDSNGNHVIRYNEIYSEWGHYFNDALGMGGNFGYKGFPNKDSDIYGNKISHVWDDAIESEGANMNVRIWGNYFDNVFHPLAIAGTSIGPLYIWRNVAYRTRRFDDTDDSDQYERGIFIKAGTKEIREQYVKGRVYIFHNTLLQPDPLPGKKYSLGCSGGINPSGGGPFYNVMTRNNIFTNIKPHWSTISDGSGSCTNDFDYDLYTGKLVYNCASRPHETHGISLSTENSVKNDLIIYDPNNRPGEFALKPGTPGFDAGVVIPNFNDGYNGIAPDMGAFEAGSLPMEFGVNAYRDGIIIVEGDVNCDGKVDILDLVLVAQNFGKLNFDQNADVNNDDKVDILDLVHVARRFT